MTATFAPFNPYEPRPVPPPEVGPGTLCAPYSSAMVRLAEWRPVAVSPSGYLEAGWLMAEPCRPTCVVVWDGAERHAVLPLPGDWTLEAGDLCTALLGRHQPEHVHGDMLG